MNAAASKRLQRRMESRGRVAGSLPYEYDCGCVSHGDGEVSLGGDENTAGGGESVSLRPLSPRAQAWLLRRVQGVEVDITKGGVEHRKKMFCCCFCCNGYYHSRCRQKTVTVCDDKTGGSEWNEASAADSPHTVQSSPSVVANLAMNVPSAVHVSYPTGSNDTSGARDATAVKKTLGTQQNKYQQCSLFNPAKASLMLSSFIRLAESSPPGPRPPPSEAVIENKRQKERASIETVMDKREVHKGHYGSRPHFKRILDAEKECGFSNTPVAAKQANTHVYEEQCSSPPLRSVKASCVNCGTVNALENYHGVVSAPCQSNKKNEIVNDGVSETPLGVHEGTTTAVQSGHTTRIISTLPSSGTSCFFVAPSATCINVSSQQPKDNAPIPTLSTAAVIQQESLPSSSSLPPPPPLPPQSNSACKTSGPPLINSEGVSGPDSQRHSVTHSAILPATTTSNTQPLQITLSSLKNEKASAVVGPKEEVKQLIEPALATVLPEPTTATKNAVVTPDDFTFDDVINALREKLFLEKTDVRVRSSEEEERLVLMQEKERQSQNFGQIMELLTRLRDEDREFLDAMYESIAQQEPEILDVVPVTEGSETVIEQNRPQSSPTVPPQFPMEIMAVYETNETAKKRQEEVCTQTEYSKLQPLQTQPVLESQPLPSPLPPPPVAFTASPPLQAPPVSLTPQLPHEVVSRSDQPPSHFVSTAPPTPLQLQSSLTPSLPQLQTQPRQRDCETPAEAARSEPLDGTARAWVDHHFGSTLDAQHRELLQHVLHSREAEVRRVEATESQCRELEARLLSAGVTNLLPATEKGVLPESLREWQQERDGELAKVLALFHAKEEELRSLQKIQKEQKAKIDEIAERMHFSLSTQLPGDLANCTGGSKMKSEETNEEIRRWKMRCEAIEQQHRLGVQRIDELQKYIEQLRGCAQQSLMKMTSGDQAPQPEPVTLRNMQVFSNMAVPAAQHLTDLQVTPQFNVNSFAPSTAAVERAAALKQLHEDFGAECGRFADETRRWNEYVKNQEELWSRMHNKC